MKKLIPIALLPIIAILAYSQYAVPTPLVIMPSSNGKNPAELILRNTAGTYDVRLIPGVLTFTNSWYGNDNFTLGGTFTASRATSKIDTYGGYTTIGMGVAPIIWSMPWSNYNSNTTFNIIIGGVNPPAGTYRMCGNLNNSTVPGVLATFGYHYQTGTWGSVNVVSILAASTQGSGCAIAYHDGTTNLQLYIGVSPGANCSGVFTLEKLL